MGIPEMEIDTWAMQFGSKRTPRNKKINKWTSSIVIISLLSEKKNDGDLQRISTFSSMASKIPCLKHKVFETMNSVETPGNSKYFKWKYLYPLNGTKAQTK